MNKILFVFFFLICMAGISFGQVSQSGFNYQAVARNSDGEILINQPITLKIQLLSKFDRDWEIEYEEIHDLRTDNIGIIHTVIGTGSILEGDFDLIPWSSESIWINIQIDTKGKGDFSNSDITKLYAVPYAIYAKTAGTLTDNDIGENKSYFGKHWNLGGNSLLHDTLNNIGTLDEQPMRFITNNQQRMTIEVGGQGIFKNDFTIERNLDVYNELHVEELSYFNNSLYIDGDINLDHNIYGHGNAYFFKNLDVQGEAFLHRDVTIDGITRINYPMNSFTKDDGALVIENGGLGIENNLNIGGDFTQDNPTDKVSIGQTLINNTENALSKDDGSLVVEGGVGIEKDVWIGGELNVEGDLKASGLIIDGNRFGPDDEISSYPVQITGIDQGIAVKINKETPISENNFITFFNEAEDAVGRIEGQSKIDILESQEWIVETTFQSAAIASSIGSFASQAATEANFVLDVGGVVVDLANHLLSIVGAGFGAVEGGAGLGDLICVIAIAVIDLAYSTVQLAGGIAGNFIDFTVTAFDATVNIANLIQYQALVFSNSGSTFSSGSADYAEWLPKMDTEDKFYTGEVIGVRHGKIVKEAHAGDKIMVISSDPLVLGNMPEPNEAHKYEKVAFMGQVPTKVMGPVKEGDYLVASKKHQGFAEAKSPKDIRLEDCQDIVGVSWGGSDIYGINYVNASIGMDENKFIPILENQVKEMDQLRREVNEIKEYIMKKEAVLAELIPGYKDQMSGDGLQIDTDMLLASSKSIEEKAKTTIENNLFNIVNQYTENRHGDMYRPMDNAQIISMVNKIDHVHGLDMSYLGAPAGPFDGIEDFANQILNKDLIADFKTAVTTAVSTAVQEIANQILTVKTEILNGVADGGGLTATERIQLEDKLDEIVPIFGLMENSGQLVTDVTSGIFEIIDEAACAVCEELDGLPIHPNDIASTIEIPVNFFLESVNFFTGTLEQIQNLEIGFSLPDPPGGSIEVEPFKDIIPDINFNVDDFPFVNNQSIDIQFPDLCKTVNCN